MSTVARKGSDEITWPGSNVRPPATISLTRPSSVTICSTGVSSSTSPPSARMSSVIVSHIWPGP